MLMFTTLRYEDYYEYVLTFIRHIWAKVGGCEMRVTPKKCIQMERAASQKSPNGYIKCTSLLHQPRF